MEWTKEKLLDYLKALADSIGEVPTQIQMDEADNMPSAAQYKNQFGSWSQALQEAGFPIN